MKSLVRFSIAGSLFLAPLPAWCESADPVINGFVLNHVGTDFNEYVEILGSPNTDYFGIWVLQIEGDFGGGIGQVDVAIRFGTTDARGLITTLYQNNRLENGTSTLILVDGFNGAQGNDLDPDDDGDIDVTPWTRQLPDCVGVSDGGVGDVTYCGFVLQPGFDGGIFAVGGASRIPHGSGAWVRNDFDNEGIPGFNGTLDVATESLNTPAAPNTRSYASGGGAAPSGLRVHDIQGVRHRSPFEGQSVSDVEGIVVAIDRTPSFAQGFYMHDPAPDHDPRTSEGIFVLTGGAPPSDISPGTRVSVDGVVEENRPAANVENLTLTRIRSLTPATQIEIEGTGSFAPAILGDAGSTPPRFLLSTVRGHVEDRPALRLWEGLDFYESFEGMLVEIPNPMAVSATNSFGEVWVVGDAGDEATGINDRGGITIREFDFNPERIQIDDGISSGATARIALGDELESVVGVMSYDFENFEVDSLSPLTIAAPAGLALETTALRGSADALTVAAFNLLNLSPSAGSRFDALAQTIVTHLGAPDILSLEEIQDDNGATNDGTVSAGTTFSLLIEAIESADPTLLDVYHYAQIDPVDNQDGGEPGGNIRVGFLYRTDRLQLASGAPGDATTNTEVGPGPSLSRNPGRLLDTDPSDGDAFKDSRKPLVAQFLFGGRSLFVIANHFNSKGGDQPLYGPSQPPTLVSEAERLRQAQRVKDFVDELLAEDRQAAVVVLGDLNDFAFSKPLDVLEGSPWQRILSNLVETLPLDERYTFIFDGNSQVLDHILVSSVFWGKAEPDIVHTNTGLLTAASDHDPIVARIELKRK